MSLYRLDPASGRFTVQAFVSGALSFFGHSPTFAVHGFSGTVNLDGPGADGLGVDVNVRADSLELVDKVKAADRDEIMARMHREVLETPAYPEIVFHTVEYTAERIDAGRYRVFLGGRLTLHGMTQPQGLNADLLIFPDGLRLRGEGMVRMSSYRIRPVSALGGTIKLKDELGLSFDLSARPRQPDMANPRILVAGIGNIFLGDDAFGVEVAKRLATRGLPEAAKVVDFGIRGLDLSYALLDDYESVLMIDALPRGGSPGTLYVLDISPSPTTSGEEGVLFELHALAPAKVLRQAASMGAKLERVYLIGCEPTPIDESEDFGAAMSAAACLAVDEAVPLIESLVERLLRGEELAPQTGELNPEKELETWQT